MSSDLKALMEMGFPENRARRALAKTGQKGAQVAMDWIFAHEDDADIDDPYEEPAGRVLGEPSGAEASKESTDGASSEAKPASSNTGEGEPVAKSLKCDDCGKILRSIDEAEFHAAKTQHSNFSESTEEKKPLTEEEKKEQLTKLQERIKQKRLEREQQEKEDQLQREKMRRSHGKDMTAAKQKMEEQEMQKIVEQRRREKEEERLARQRVKDQIERDKKDRAAKFAKGSTTDSPAAPAPPPAAAPAKQVSKTEHTETRLQIRLPTGKNLTQTFKVRESLAHVRVFVEQNWPERGDLQFKFMTPFPRKEFTEEDMEKPLSSLDLVPSAVVVVTMRT